MGAPAANGCSVNSNTPSLPKVLGRIERKGIRWLGSTGSLIWRTTAEKGFSSSRIVAYDWPAADWQDVKVTLPVVGNLIHLRLSTPNSSQGLAVQVIQLAPQQSDPIVFDFSKSTAP
jgi:hypothetical protein